MTEDSSSLRQIIEGAILAADTPLSIDQMLQLFGSEPPPRAEIRAVIEEIEASCEDRGFELKQVASGYRFQVKKQYAQWVGRLWEEKPPRYTRALLETLALIAYKQPITRGDIEEIRGVAVSTNIIRSLLEREWIRVVGHRDVPGRPAMYATTRIFLDYFNLSSLEELPTLSEIRDLDAVNEELDLQDEPLVEIKSLELDEEEEAALEEADADLDEVTANVNQIQDNIRQLFTEPGEEPLDDDDREAVPDEAAVTAETAEPATESPMEEPASESPEGETQVTDAASPETGPTTGESAPNEPADNRQDLSGVVPADILNAAFADDEDDESGKPDA